jgi:hypothetical protein
LNCNLVGTIYCNTPEYSTYRFFFFQLCKNEGLSDLKTKLSQDSVSVQVQAKALQDDADFAVNSIERWFALVPEIDRRGVAELLQSVRAADTNRDGRLDETKLQAMNETDRKLWKKRVQLAGG